MGKCKQRIFSRAKTYGNLCHISRTQAVRLVSCKLEYNPQSISARNLISLFGLSAEELSESGVSYEVLRSLNALMI